MVSEEAVRSRSHEIWLKEGRPEGRALEHWLRAEAELEAEQRRRELRIAEYQKTVYRFEELRQRVVLPRPRISSPPQVTMARRISRDEHPVAA
jgi:hypothetical protein